MPKRTSTTDQALEYICGRIEKGGLRTGDKLPSAHALAQTAHLSRTSMMRAIRILHHKGLLDVKSRVGVFVDRAGVRSGKKRPTPQLQSAMERLVQRISRDIVEGRFAQTDHLPSLKELERVYGVSYRTMKQALNLLTSQQRLEPSRRRHRIIRHGATSPGSSLTFIHGAEFFTLMEMSYFKSWFYVFLDAIEKECFHRRLQMQWRMYDGRMAPDNPIADSLGFIVWLDASLEEKLPNLVSSLLRWGKPIVLIDEARYDLPSIPCDRRITIFRIANRHAGLQIGRFLLDHGHRRVCFLARSHQPYADQRFQGVKDAFESSGLKDASLSSLFQFDLPAGIAGSTGDTDSIRLLRNEHQRIEEDIGNLRKQIADPFTKTGLQDHLIDFVYELNLRYALIPLFRTAMKLRATAWILLDDYLAVYGALQFLKKEGVKVPQELSLVGFGNMIESFKNDITSYNFNMPALVGRIMDALLWPARGTVASINHAEEVEGFLTVRGSTRKTHSFSDLEDSVSG